MVSGGRQLFPVYQVLIASEQSTMLHICPEGTRQDLLTFNICDFLNDKIDDNSSNFYLASEDCCVFYFRKISL